ncbi:glutathione S-transferase 1-like [Condylostylus longicornis]|uniref:glutathione S-transferase 1-like n=1 Tax=Condylostylus longicornis TaxID=2530218 RepID=UPI00244DF991|nr:glutathione S-transferase 1-like [Condylostylus longicornis]
MANKPILYYSQRSPPCRSVLLVAAELGLELDLKAMNLIQREHFTPEFLQKNPQHTIPCLEDNGTIIIDSHVISAYLVEKYGKDDKLYPKDEEKRRLVDTLLYFDASNVFSRIRFLYEPIIYFGQKGFPQDKIDYIQKAYEPLENYLKANTYITGENLTIADLCLLASVSSVSRTVPIDVEKFPKLHAWFDKLTKLPYYKEANFVGAEMLQDLVIEKSK